jgi:hypothetical protein
MEKCRAEQTPSREIDFTETDSDLLPLIIFSLFLAIRIRLYEDLYEKANFGLVLLQTHKRRCEYDFGKCLEIRLRGALEAPRQSPAP